MHNRLGRAYLTGMALFMPCTFSHIDTRKLHLSTFPFIRTAKLAAGSGSAEATGSRWSAATAATARGTAAEETGELLGNPEAATLGAYLVIFREEPGYILLELVPAFVALEIINSHLLFSPPQKPGESAGPIELTVFLMPLSGKGFNFLSRMIKFSEG